METLYGTGFGTKPVYARAARLETENGRPTLDAELLATLARNAERSPEVWAWLGASEGDGTLDIVLVAQDAAFALLTPLPAGLNLVGVVAERPLHFAPAGRENVAIVANVPDALQSIGEGNLLIVDPAQSRVLVEPSAEEFVRLQEFGAKRARVRLGAAHIVARTHSGREVGVYAYATSPEDLWSATDNGADGLYLPAPSVLLPDDDDEAALAGLFSAVEAIGGGNLVVQASPADINVSALLAVAFRCVLHWAVPPAEVDTSLSELRAQLADQVQTEEELGNEAAVPHIALVLTGANDLHTPPADITEADTIIIPDPTAITFEPDVLFGFPPAIVVLPQFYERLDEAVEAGARTVVVSPAQIEEAKNRIRGIE
jgi:hypothetical protein